MAGAVNAARSMLLTTCTKGSVVGDDVAASLRGLIPISLQKILPWARRFLGPRLQEYDVLILWFF
jgi:hypothetical protein